MPLALLPVPHMPAKVGPAPVAKKPSDVSRPVDGSIVKAWPLLLPLFVTYKVEPSGEMTRPVGELALMAVPTWVLVAASKILTSLTFWAAT